MQHPSLALLMSRRNLAQLRFALDRIGSYPALLDRIGTDAGFAEAGSLLLMETEDRVVSRRAFLADPMQLPCYDGFVLLDAVELADLEPFITSPRIIAASYRARDCMIDPPALCAGLASGVRREGVAVAEGARAEQLARTGRSWRLPERTKRHGRQKHAAAWHGSPRWRAPVGVTRQRLSVQAASKRRTR